jgi:hypothetical protein
MPSDATIFRRIHVGDRQLIEADAQNHRTRFGPEWNGRQW